MRRCRLYLYCDVFFILDQYSLFFTQASAWSILSPQEDAANSLVGRWRLEHSTLDSTRKTERVQHVVKNLIERLLLQDRRHFQSDVLFPEKLMVYFFDRSPKEQSFGSVSCRVHTNAGHAKFSRPGGFQKAQSIVANIIHASQR